MDSWSQYTQFVSGSKNTYISRGREEKEEEVKDKDGKEEKRREKIRGGRAVRKGVERDTDRKTDIKDK